MKKFILGFIFFANSGIAQPIATPEQEVEVYGLPAGWVLSLVVIVLGLIWGYLQKNKMTIVNGLKELVNNYVENDLLAKTMNHLVEAAYGAAEITYRDLYKKMEIASEDGRLTEGEKEELMVYAKKTLKGLLPEFSRNILKKHGMANDDVFKAEIEKAVTGLKRMHRMSKIDNTVKSNINDGE